MKIKINKYNYIVEYAEIGDIENSIECDFKFENDILDYQFIKNKPIYNPIPKDKPIGVNVIYDGSKFVDIGTPQEKQDFWRKKMIETNNQIKELQEIGLGGGSEESSLRAKLEEYRTQYMNAVQEEAIEIDKGMA